MRFLAWKYVTSWRFLILGHQLVVSYRAVSYNRILRVSHWKRKKLLETKGCFSENETHMQKLLRSYCKFNFLTIIRLFRMKLIFNEILWSIFL